MSRPTLSHLVTSRLTRREVALQRRMLIESYGRRAFDRARKSGEIVAILPDVYVHRSNAADLRTRIAAANLYLDGRGAISGVAACALMGLDYESAGRVTVVVPAKRRIDAPKWVRIRYLLHPLPTDRSRGVLVVSLPHALIQAYWDEGIATARNLMLDAIRRRRVTGPQLALALDDYPRITKRRVLRKFLSLLKDGVHSYLEYLGDTTVLNVPDLRHLERQEEFRVQGMRFFVDAFDAETMTAFEFDGAAYHSDDGARRRDLERDAALATIGVQTIRFTYEDVTQRPQWCRTIIRDVLAARRGHLSQAA